MPSALNKSTEKARMFYGELTDAFDFVIEAKSKKEDNPLYKNDHAQLSKPRLGLSRLIRSGIWSGFRRCPRRSPIPRRALPVALP